MRAAVVTSFDSPPRYEDYPTPHPSGEHDALVQVVASGLHPRVRSQANGSHYTSTEQLPLVPGVDGVGRLADGTLVNARPEPLEHVERVWAEEAVDGARVVLVI